jgi:5-methylcytosine-specific restriction endonuclease McrA
MPLPLQKPEPRRKVKARADRKFAKHRNSCRKAVFARANGCCERCWKVVSDDLPEWHAQRAAVNEKVPRSLGGSAVDMANLELLCQACHMPNGRHAPTAERMRKIQERA